jgi:GNAT superfamily N-acetyltransferase
MSLFRRATSFDVSALASLINDAYVVEAFFKIGDRTDHAEVTSLLDKSAFLIYEEGDSMVGCVHVAVRGARGYFGFLAVHPSRRGEGIGARLVAAAEAFCREAGCVAVDLSVVNLRTDLLPYYRALGYRERTTAPFPSPERTSQPCHMLVMSKEF